MRSVVLALAAALMVGSCGADGKIKQTCARSESLNGEYLIVTVTCPLRQDFDRILKEELALPHPGYRLKQAIASHPVEIIFEEDKGQ